jgi:hypothetical protein
MLPRFPLSVLALAATCCAHAQTIERVRLTDNDLNCTQIYAEVQQMDSLIAIARSNPAPQQLQPPQQIAQPAAPSPFSMPAIGHGMSAQHQQVQQMMLMSNDPRVRAAASDPAMVAQTAAMLQNPQLAAATQRAAAAGVNQGAIQNQLMAATAIQQAAAHGNATAALSAPSAGQAYAQAGGLAGMLNSGMAAQGGSGGSAAGIAGIFGALAGAASRSQAAPAPAQQQVTQQYAPAAAAPAANNLGMQAQARKDHLTGMFLSKGCRLADVQK